MKNGFVLWLLPVMLLAGVFCGGCGEPRIDGSSEQALRVSVEELHEYALEHYSEDDRRMMASVLAGVDRALPEPVALRVLHGATPSDLLNWAENPKALKERVRQFCLAASPKH